MAIDLELDSIESLNRFDIFSNQPIETEHTFHHAIAPNLGQTWTLSKNVYPSTSRNTTDQKVEASFRNALAKSAPKDAGGSVGAELTVGWGGKDGTKVSGSLQAEAHDDNGNYGSAQFKHNDDGTSEIKVGGGHKEGDGKG
jgi:hypothetical protein